jgi:hypothetical protein
MKLTQKKLLSSPKHIRTQVDIFTSLNFSILTIYMRLSRTERSPDDKDIEKTGKQKKTKKKTQEPTLKPETKCFAQQQQTYVQ